MTCRFRSLACRLAAWVLTVAMSALRSLLADLVLAGFGDEGLGQTDTRRGVCLSVSSDMW